MSTNVAEATNIAPNDSQYPHAMRSHIGLRRADSVERIAEPSYGFDQLVPPWPVYLLAQPRYAGLHDVRARIEAVSPYPFEDHVP